MRHLLATSFAGSQYWCPAAAAMNDLQGAVHGIYTQTGQRLNLSTYLTRSVRWLVCNILTVVVFGDPLGTPIRISIVGTKRLNHQIETVAHQLYTTIHPNNQSNPIRIELSHISMAY